MLEYRCFLRDDSFRQGTPSSKEVETVKRWEHAVTDHTALGGKWTCCVTEVIKFQSPHLNVLRLVVCYLDEDQLLPGVKPSPPPRHSPHGVVAEHMEGS